MYEKEKQLAKKIADCKNKYHLWPDGEKKKIKRRIEKLNTTILGFILEEFDEEEKNTEFYNLIEENFIALIATNDSQRRFLKESLQYKKDNLEKMKRNERITIDTYNPGKHTDKFSRRKSGKTKKGKAYSKIRVKEISFS